MNNALLSILAAVAMLFVAIFHDNQYVVGFGLLIMGLSFSKPVVNRRQAISLVFISAYGPLMLIDSQQWQLLPFIAGSFLVISTIGQDEEEGTEATVIKMLIGFSWYYLAIPAACFFAAALMTLMSFGYVFAVIIEELTEDRSLAFNID